MNIAVNIIKKIVNKDNKIHIENKSEEPMEEEPMEEEPMEEMICGICLDPQTHPFKTSCNHSFCVSCLVRASVFKNNFNFPCPLCRETVTNMKDAIQFYKNDETNEKIDAINILPPFNSELYPIDADFEFVNFEGDRRMLISAYNIITREEKWRFLHDYSVSEQTGFLWASGTELNILLEKIEEDYRGHSGSSMGYTIRKMHFISKYGYIEFKNEWYRWN